MRQLSQLHGASIGRGPKHPDLIAEHRISQMNYEIAKFFEVYPGASSDQGYQEFLYFYAGGLIERDDFLLHIWGPDEEFAENYVWEDVLFDPAHYCPFCCIKIGNTGRIDYGFAKHLVGVYQATESVQNEIRIIWYCDSFSEWLRFVVIDINKVLQ